MRVVLVENNDCVVSVNALSEDKVYAFSKDCNVYLILPRTSIDPRKYIVVQARGGGSNYVNSGKSTLRAIVTYVIDSGIKVREFNNYSEFAKFFSV
jgi:hypothetical protein